MQTQKNIVLFDDTNRENLLPLTFTRPVSELRIGISTLKEKWDLVFNAASSYLTEEYLSGKYPLVLTDDNYFINAAVIPDDKLAEKILKLNTGEGLKLGSIPLAYRFSKPVHLSPETGNSLKILEYNSEVLYIEHTWDIFRLNERVLHDDYLRITRGRKSAVLSSTNQILGKENVFIEEGVTCECAVINATTGPVYFGRNTEIMEGSVIRGPFALCEHSTLKIGAKIYGATTIGPYCKVGGEVHNSVFIGFSSKAHDGFLGNAVLGEWCNLGAGTNNSNLKNNYAIIKLWNYSKGHFVDTGLQFCGLIMGDHSKCAINTMFNTGTVVGVCTNIYGTGFPRNFIPSFTWGGPAGVSIYSPEKVFETARIAMARRGKSLTHEDETILLKIFDLTRKYRKE